LVSDEAFRLSSSSAVCLIIDALRALSATDNAIAFAQLAYTYQEQIQPNFDANLIDFFTAYTLARTSSSVPNSLPFREYLPTQFTTEFSKLQKLPLYELAEKIIAIFNLFEQKNQHAFLYDFLDKLNVYVAQNSSNIEDFLEFWTDELQHKTITINAQVSGVRILTIHKSKGLEFHTVVVPFCEWNMDEVAAEQLVWHESVIGTDVDVRASANVGANNYLPLRDNIFEEMPLIPLNYGKKLKDSHFFTDFENETLKLWVDNLNLLYVALTRPKHNLLVLAEALPKKSDILRASNLLHNAVNPLIDGMFQEGELTPSIEKEDETFDGNIFKMPLQTFEVPFSIAQKQPKFYLSKEAKEWSVALRKS